MNTHPHQPWHRLWQEHRRAVRTAHGWGGMALTLFLIAIGIVILWIAFRGSNRLKAAASVWVVFP